jgi:hypothetical protein
VALHGLHGGQHAALVAGLDARLLAQVALGDALQQCRGLTRFAADLTEDAAADHGGNHRHRQQAEYAEPW